MLVPYDEVSGLAQGLEVTRGQMVKGLVTMEEARY